MIDDNPLPPASIAKTESQALVNLAGAVGAVIELLTERLGKEETPIDLFILFMAFREYKASGFHLNIAQDIQDQIIQEVKKRCSH